MLQTTIIRFDDVTLNKEQEINVLVTMNIEKGHLCSKRVIQIQCNHESHLISISHTVQVLLLYFVYSS